MEIILFEPEIPPNTGNIARLCAGLGLKLNLIEPLGFKIDDKHLKRAGLDYWPLVELALWPNWDSFEQAWTGGRLWASSARQGLLYTQAQIGPDDGLVFGPETRGLPADIKERLAGPLRVPIVKGVRSLNLATTVGLITGEALRQNDLFIK